MNDLTIVLAVAGVFKGGGDPAALPPEDEGTFQRWLSRLADALKRLAGKAAEALPTILRSVVGTILIFYSKAVGLVAEHTWALIVVVAGLIEILVKQKILG